MDRCEKKNKRHQIGKKPRVPIKTYKWEDVKRSRRRGGYPWTYLYKQSFDELVDPKQFTMDGLKKSKTSTASSASDSLDIKEITEDDVEGLKNIDSSYVVIEGPILLEENAKDHQDGFLESADSSDNISQYLDKEERGPSDRQSTETLTLETEVKGKIKTIERAKSEEPKRKRKLSIESNYSRISLSKLGLMKRFKEAKDKIKFSSLRKQPKKEKEVKSAGIKAEGTNEKKEFPSLSVNVKNEKPVYIHIPLKPAEGETDEFSYLEFEEKRPPITITEPKIEDENEQSENFNIEEIITTASDEKEMEEETKTGGLSVPKEQDEDDVSAIIFLEGEGDENKENYDIMVVDIDEKSQEMTMSQLTNNEVRRQVLESIKRVESQGELERGSTNNLSRSSSRASKTSKTSIRKRRAKSMEPEKKRKSSIDSSYSHKSLSKISFLKKLKQINFPFGKSRSKKSISSESASTPTTTPAKEKDVDTTPTQHQKNKTSKNEEPLYIRVPLKPPPGQTDEFSYLEFEESKPAPSTEKEVEAIAETTEEIEKTAPQLIFLTPPSDDEILEKPGDVPETPSSETGSLFHFGDLKQLARSAVDQIHGPLDSVYEEMEEIPRKTEEELIDEEDGLKSSPTKLEPSSSTEETNVTSVSLKSNLKGESSPSPKKKVSFKRRKSSQTSKDNNDGYEVVQSLPSSSSIEVAATTVDLNDDAVDQVQENQELAGHLTDNDEKICTDFSREDFNNKWSKLSDHEYEPVNPPADDDEETFPSKSHVSEVLNPPSDITQIDPLNNKNRFDLIEDERKTTEKKDSPSNDENVKIGQSGSKKIQSALKESAAKFKTKFHQMKRPNIALPSKPKFQKPNINLTLPKFPDISSPFRRNDRKSSNQTESRGQQGGVFDFSTYPRIFKNKKKKTQHDSGSLKRTVESTTIKKNLTSAKDVESSKGDSNIVRIPLHSEASMDLDNDIVTFEEQQNDDNIEESSSKPQKPHYFDDLDLDLDTGGETEIGIEKNTRKEWEDEEQHLYYNQEYNINDPEERQVVTDLDQLDEEPIVPIRQKTRLQRQKDEEEIRVGVKGEGSSASSLRSRRGVLEEIDSDHFFLREKGISQDNIDVGRYLSTEIREAFRASPPENALADSRAYNYEEDVRLMTASNRSLPAETAKKKTTGVKKPKRRKTPHASQERFRYEREESEENEVYNFMPPIRPKRKSRRRKKNDQNDENIIVASSFIDDSTPKFEEFDGYRGQSTRDRSVERNFLRVSHQYNEGCSNFRRASEPAATPAPPTRKHKSLKSLDASERGSIIFDDYEQQATTNGVAHYDIQNRFEDKDSSLWLGNEENRVEEKEEEEISPKAPIRNRSKTRSRNEDDEDVRTPVVEELCVKDLRDAMGYAIVEKNQNKNWEHKFCTVPRSREMADDRTTEKPERPVRNYSTLGPSRPPRKHPSTASISRNMTDEEKENVDITQYIEIDDEVERDLQSGEVIQKVQKRPLPAPPRPHRRGKARTPLDDVTASNGNREIDSNEHVPQDSFAEIEVSTQTEPLPSDFVCEEMVQEVTDKIMTPSVMRKNNGEEVEVRAENSSVVERILLTPTKFSYQEETITHGQLLVEPLNGANILPDSELTKPEIIVPTSIEYNEDDLTSEIPEYFEKLSNTHPVVEDQKTEETPVQETHVIKTQKLQITDLDVERLTVNELVANKIVVSEIESGNLISNEINSKTIKMSTDIGLEATSVKKLLEQLQQQSSKLEQQQGSILCESTEEEGEKKTPIEDDDVIDLVSSHVTTPCYGNESICDEETTIERKNETNCDLIKTESRFEENEKKSDDDNENSIAPNRPPRNADKKCDNNTEITATHSSEETNEVDNDNTTLESERPIRPPRNFEKTSTMMIEDEIDEEAPPPRPPQPQLPLYFVDSQPPASFYALRAQRYVHEHDIPKTRKHHHHHQHHKTRIFPSSSSSSSESPLFSENCEHQSMMTIRRRFRNHGDENDMSIPRLAGRLACACGALLRDKIKRLIDQVNSNLAKNLNDSPSEYHVTDQKNIQLIIVFLLVLIAGLLLLGYGDGRTVHTHHWDYLSPPKDS